MATKIRVKVGGVEVDYEGPEEFLNKKLPELISLLSKLAAAPAAPTGGTSEGGRPQAGTLASFLKEKRATSNQNKKFLATAEWLHLRGHKRVSTGDVTAALKDNNQSRLGNASQCLNSNVGSGFCEKDGKQFYVTDEGRKALA